MSFIRRYIKPRKPPSTMSNEEQMEWCEELASKFDFCNKDDKDAIARIMYKSVRYMLKDTPKPEPETNDTITKQ